MSTFDQNKVGAMNASDVGQLKKNSNKEELCGYIQHLRGRVEELESYQLIAKRVQLLERSHLNALQYQRRESIEIYGLPETVTDGKLEETCMEILEEIGCGKIKGNQIHACHRLKNKNNTIIRFVNRKHANMALHNRKKLKNINKAKYGLMNSIYINESLCRPMKFLSYKVRVARKEGKISSYNLWKGKLTVKRDDDDFVISHIDDLIELNLADEADRLSFLK